MNFDVISPGTKDELLETIKNLGNRNFRFGAGCTDLLPELKKNPQDDLIVVNLAQINDSRFSSITTGPGSLYLGARVTAHNILMNEIIMRQFPVLHEAALNLASTQIRQVATIGGNMCTASPSGDIACALMALGADCELLDTDGNARIVPIKHFFKGVRKTILRKNELLYAIIIHADDFGTDKINSGFIKVGLRRSMECSVVSLAYHILCNPDGVVTKCGVAIGASAPTIRFTDAACHHLVGKKLSMLNNDEIATFAKQVVSCANPISDIRASAWYRTEVLYNISMAMLENFTSHGA
jgi:CO/xanthine dehydrogenase FAD-binding subunit